MKIVTGVVMYIVVKFDDHQRFIGNLPVLLIVDIFYWEIIYKMVVFQKKLKNIGQLLKKKNLVLKNCGLTIGPAGDNFLHTVLRN